MEFLEQNFGFAFFVFMRVSGMLFISPLLSNKAISGAVRFYLAIFLAAVISTGLWPVYSNLHISLAAGGILPLVLLSLKELLVGYILGFCFNVVFEAMLLAGEMIDSMIGFSAAQFIDPISNTFHTMLGQLLVFLGALYMLIMDFHHVFIRMIADSFLAIPIGQYHMGQGLLDKIILVTSWMFTFAIKYGAIPIVILSINLVGIACTVRVVPEMNLLLTGLPLRVMFGVWSLMIAISWIVPLFKETFMQVALLVEQIMLDL